MVQILVVATVAIGLVAALVWTFLYIRCGGLWVNGVQCFVQSNTIDHRALGWARSAPTLSIPVGASVVTGRTHDFVNSLLATLPLQIEVAPSYATAKITVRGFSRQTSSPVFVWVTGFDKHSCSKAKLWQALGLTAPPTASDLPSLQRSRYLARVDATALQSQGRFETAVYVDSGMTGEPASDVVCVHVGLLQDGRWMQDSADCLHLRSFSPFAIDPAKIVNEDSKASARICYGTFFA